MFSLLEESEINSIKNHYNNIYTIGDHYFNPNPDILLQECLEYIPIGKSLELGIGIGKNVNFLLQNGFSVEGVDFSDVIIEELKNKYCNSKCIFKTEDITSFNIPVNTYSLIICSMSISYLSKNNIKKLINNIKNGLIYNGVVLINTLSENDPIFNINQKNKMLADNKLSKNNINYLNFKQIPITKNEMKNYFNDFEIITLNDLYLKEPKRITGGYYGLIMYMGRKNINK